MGNLTREPELRWTPNGKAVCEIGMAINREWRNDKDEKMSDVIFVDVTLWGKAGEAVAEYLKKGDPIFVNGRLQMDSWTDKATGQKRTKLKVVAEGFQFIGGKRQEDGEERERYDQKAERNERPPANRPARPPVDPDLDPESEDDIPFN